MKAFNPYEWHEHHMRNKPRWRVRAGQAEARLELIRQLNELNEIMETGETTFAQVDKWSEIHKAILACEENEAE